MNTNQENSENTANQNFYSGVFLACFIYWFYLLFTSKMDLVHDAIGYDQLGRLIADEGWVAFFKQGPNREPLYPFVISISMQLSKLSGIAYFYIQKFIQILFLFTTQLMICRILCSYHIHRLIISLTILYLGFSPALVNSTFSLYSEIATFPLLVGIILTGLAAWRHLLQTHWSALLYALLLSFLFLALTLTKAIFTIIFILFCFPFIFLAVRAILKRQFLNTLLCLLFLVLTSSTYFLGIHSYKSLNQRYNGQYVITDRGPWAFYGNTIRRMQPMNVSRILTGVTFTAGEGFCEAVFEKEDCDFWSFRTSDFYGTTKFGELKARHLTPTEIDQQLLNFAKQEVLKNPFQYGALTILEGFKMFFWESTRIGFVTYPDWLKEIFTNSTFKNLLRLFIFLLTLTAWMHTTGWILRKRHLLIKIDDTSENSAVHLGFFIWLMTFSYMTIYSLFFILTRYALPIAPLYLLLIAFTMQHYFFRENSTA